MNVMNARDRNLPAGENQKGKRPVPAPTDWSALKPSDHFVQFHETDTALVDAVSSFLGAGLESGENCLIIAAPSHRESVESTLAAQGFDLLTAAAQGRYVALDAAETLSAFMSAGSDQDSSRVASKP